MFGDQGELLFKVGQTVTPLAGATGGERKKQNGLKTQSSERRDISFPSQGGFAADARAPIAFGKRKVF